MLVCFLESANSWWLRLSLRPQLAAMVHGVPESGHRTDWLVKEMQETNEIGTGPSIASSPISTA